MSYGRFSEDGREFIITTPLTPRPWANYLTNGRYCCLISQTGGGYSFFQSSGYHRLTRAHPSLALIEDRPGRYIYVRDEETGKIWSLNWQPVQAPYEWWECRHGLGYTVIRSRTEGIEGEIVYFVPLHDHLEVWKVTLRNPGEAPRHLSLFAFVEWALGSYGFDLLETAFANLFKRVEYHDGVISAGMKYWNLGHGPAKPHLEWDRLAFMAAGFPVVSFDTLKESFLGRYGYYAAPAGVKAGHLSNSLADGQDVVGAMHTRVRLDPGQSYSFTVLVGTVGSREEIPSLREKYGEAGFADRALEEVKRFWDDYLDKFWVDTPDKEFDLSVNIWNRYQCWVTFNWSRMASYYIGGGSIVGFRDSSQDLLGVLPINPYWAKRKVLYMWRHQFRDGGTLHNWDPISDIGPRTGHSDDALWPVLATFWYLRETGDLDFLKEKVPFYDGGEGTVLDHMRLSLSYTLSRRSERGLALMGEADWNDALDQVGIEGRGESVMTSEFLAWMLKDMASLMRTLGEEEAADRYRREYEELVEKINRYCWQGNWYIRATTDGGRILGGEERIYINSQTWAVLSETARGERALACLEAVRKYLDTPYGPCLFLPSFREVEDDVGIITMFAPGVKENGTIFNHTVTWCVIAECLLGRGTRAYELWKKTSFLTRGKNPDLYKAEPYVYAEYVHGADSPFFGQGEFTWMTGTAAWMLRACLDYILGVRPELEGLRIDPVIPAAWSGFRVKRHFRGAVYEIEVKNPAGVERGVKEIRVDGQPIEGQVIAPHGDGRVHHVEVIMGRVSASEVPAEVSSSRAAR